MANEMLEEYLSLLEIRKEASRRTTWILGPVLFLSLTSLFIIGMIQPISQREAVLITILIASFALGFVVSLARREVLNAACDLAIAIVAGEQAP